MNDTQKLGKNNKKMKQSLLIPSSMIKSIKPEDLLELEKGVASWLDFDSFQFSLLNYAVTLWTKIIDQETSTYVILCWCQAANPIAKLVVCILPSVRLIQTSKSLKHKILSEKSEREYREDFV